MSELDLAIPKLILDPQNDEEMLQQYHLRVQSASNGLLNDRTVGSVQSAIGEGVIFSMMELLYYANMLPEALALEVFRLFGVSRSPGTYATGTLNFTLRGKLSTAFTLPEGYLIPYSPDGVEGQGYVLTDSLYIAPNTLQGSVSCRASDYGEQFNLDPLALYIDPGLNYVEAVYNVERISGGSSIEYLAATVARAQRELRSRDVLVSIADYEYSALELLGVPGKAKAVPRLGSDKVSLKTGQVHVFVTEADHNAPAIATCQYIQSQLQERSFVASSTWVSPADTIDVNVEAVFSTDQLSEDLAMAVESAIAGYLYGLDIGADIRINKLNFNIQSVEGVGDLVTLRINDQPLDVPMPNKWSVPRLSTVTVTQVDATGLSQTFVLSRDIGDPD